MHCDVGASFDHLVGAREQCGEYFESEGATTSQNPRQRTPMSQVKHNSHGVSFLHAHQREVG
jgi:hypothetical protein